MSLRLSFLLGAVALVLAGCDGTVDDDFEPQLVVSAFLGAEEPLPPVSLSETAPLLDPFDPEAVAVSGATVSVSLLAADGSVETVYPYEAGPEVGLYLPLSSLPFDLQVLPERTYRLDVTGPDGDVLTAETTVPPKYRVVEGPADEVPYGIGQGPEVRITESSTDARRAAFVGSTRALAADDYEAVIVDGETKYRSLNLPDRFRPVPIVQRFFDCVEEAGGTLLCDDDPTVDALVGTSPVINEASYIDLGDGTILVQVPFLAFGFYGPQRLNLVSLDVAFQDFVQTQTIQGGGSTLSPGEIPNVTTNVEGGLGVFGSFAREAVGTTLVEPALP
ncbi:MAG: DUF4249 family protein [Bacteroidota bacterium]